MLLRTLTVATAVLTLASSSAWAANPPNDYGPPFRYCGHFKSDYVIHVYSKKLRCRKARAIQREFWNGRARNRTVVNGGSGYAGYVLLDKFPGWRCGSGSGGGACTKGKRIAAYAN